MILKIANTKEPAKMERIKTLKLVDDEGIIGVVDEAGWYLVQFQVDKIEDKLVLIRTTSVPSSSGVRLDSKRRIVDATIP
jgi:hypothetical protein